MSVDKGIPKYIEIKLDILAKIKAGVWAVGSSILSEKKIIEMYTGSRITVRRAMEELEKEGYIKRIQGKGTFVTSAAPRLVKQVGEIKSFSHQLEEAGMKPTTQVIEVGLCRAGDAHGRVIEGFEIAENEEVVRIARLKSGDDIPFALQTVYLLPRNCPEILGLPREDLLHLFKLYQTIYSRTIATADEVLRIANASEEEARLLQIEPGAPVVLRDRISFDQFGEAFEVLHSVDLPDRVVYHYRVTNDLTKLRRG